MRDAAVAAWRWLAEASAHQMHRRFEPIDDLVQVCMVGLLEALERYDPARGASFRTYASRTIAGVLRHHYRAAWRLRVPRPVQELHLRLAGTIEALTAELARSPTADEVAARSGASVDEVIESLDAGVNFRPLSLSYDEMGRAVELARPDSVDAVVQRADIVALLARLPVKARKVLYLRFVEERSQTDVAGRLDMTQVQVSRVERAALARLRAYDDPR